MPRVRSKESRAITTKFFDVVNAIVKKPVLPTEKPKGDAGYFVKGTEEEVAKRFAELAPKWKKIIASGELSLDSFANLTQDYLQTDKLNKSKVNRVLYTGNPKVTNSPKRVPEEALVLLSIFSKKYSVEDLKSLAKEALDQMVQIETEQQRSPEGLSKAQDLDSPNDDIDVEESDDDEEVKSDITPPVETLQALGEEEEPLPGEPQQVPQVLSYNNGKVEHSDSRAKEQKTLSEYVLKYVQAHGYKKFTENEISPEDILKLLSDEMPEVGILYLLRDILQISSDQLLEAIHYSYKAKKVKT